MLNITKVVLKNGTREHYIIKGLNITPCNIDLSKREFTVSEEFPTCKICSNVMIDEIEKMLRDPEEMFD